MLAEPYPTAQFTARHLQMVRAICDTLVPDCDPDLPDVHGFYARKASDLDIPAKLLAVIDAVIDDSTRAQMRMALEMLDWPAVNLFFGRKALSFLDMTLSERTALLRDWADSRLEVRRRLFSAFKRLALLLFYTEVDDSGCNPNWPAIGYPGPTPVPAERRPAKTIRPLEFFEDSTLMADVVIVGSGAGGGVVADELSAAGLDVIVLEKGGYFAEPDFDGLEVPSQRRMFEKGGFVTTADLSLVILAGSALGGATTFNWAASLRTPKNVLDEWETRFGVTGYGDQTYQDALDAVSARINVNTDHCVANARNAVLLRGCQALGWAIQPIPQNVKDCVDCGFCCFGCPYGAKQTALRTFLQNAYARGTRIAVHARAERVLIENGRAVGVAATARGANGAPVRLTVRARAVVAAAGALHTPALLLRSGLTGAHIGRNLHLHPSSGTFGFYSEPIHGWQGVMMSHYVPQFSDLDGHGYGFALESAPAHPGLAALSLPWESGEQHKRLMARYAHMANILIITRDRDSGRITLDRHGNPVIHYRLSPHDRAHLMRGVLESLRIHHAAGAEHMLGPNHRVGSFAAHGGESSETLESYLRRTEAMGLPPNGFLLGSAHQMSSCRMGGNPARGAVDPTGETFEVRGLFVADASALPTATGVNPMLTIMAVAYSTAQHIKARLT